MFIERYFNELKRRIEPLFVKAKTTPITTQRCCINITGQQINIVHFDQRPTGIELYFAETRFYDEADNLSSILAGLVQKHELENIPVHWLLSPDDYQLFLIESLPVKEEEFRDALNWRIRSLINYPIEEANIDYFMLPAKKSSPDSPMIAAIAARQAQLTRMIEIFTKSELSLTVITVPELALKQLSALYENDEKSTAFIYFYDKTAILNITLKKVLYFTRQIVIPADDNYNEKISLEILRYFDYFQSQWRHPSPSRIFILSVKDNLQDKIKPLSEYLSATVEPYQLKTPVLNQPNYDGKCVLEIGCLLQEGAK